MSAAPKPGDRAVWCTECGSALVCPCTSRRTTPDEMMLDNWVRTAATQMMRVIERGYNPNSRCV